MRIAIYGRVIRPENAPFIQELFDKLHTRNHELVIVDSYIDELKKFDLNLHGNYEVHPKQDDLKGKVDYIISFGGDGTILDTATIVRDSNIPILGVNIGRLGFLSTIGKEQISDAISALEKGNYIVDKRSLIHLESKPSLFGNLNFAMNEFTIHKRDSASMITIHVYLNGEFVNSYWADGLIVCTPTGSTGYSLSCGGPIVFPGSGSFVITPVAPHNLNIRPLVVKDDSVISFEIEGRADNYLVTLDSRYVAVPSSTQLAIRKEDFTVPLIRLEDRNFLTTLRKKLNLGIDARN
ncbi:MAG: NAD+ kinase [Limisphaerales bacterium]|jgi:NAD+ kinase